MADREFTSIVVLGAMNPRIHHPHWYAMHETMNKEEVDSALKNDLLCTPPASHIATQSFSVDCLEGRWEIKTDRKEQRNRILQVAMSVFRRLNETPVNSFGFNFHMERITAVESVAEFLANKVKEARIGLEIQGAASAEIAIRDSTPAKVIQTRISPSLLAADYITVAHNFHYPIHLEPFEYFDVSSMLEDRFEQDYNSALHRTQRVIEVLNETKSTHANTNP